jgi:hypothetical protein
MDDLSDNRSVAGCPVVGQEVPMPKTPSARTVKRRTRRWKIRMEALDLSNQGVARMQIPNQDLNASYSPPAVGSPQTADVSALLAEETFQASSPVPAVADSPADSETPADEVPRRAKVRRCLPTKKQS